MQQTARETAPRDPEPANRDVRSRTMTTAKKITTAKAAHQPVEAALAAGKETIETVVKAGAEAASKGVERAVAARRETVTAAVKAGTEAFKSYEDIVSFGKDNVDAVVKTNAILVK